MITLATLIAAGVGPTQARLFADPLAAACERFQINTPARMGAFVAQCMVESTRFTRTEENLFYTSSERVRQIFPTSVHSLQQAATLTRNPKALANVVYANRLGNGDEASGDGWTFRGRGCMAITGRNNYTDAAQNVDPTWLANPDALALPPGASMSAAWFWSSNRLNVLADAGLIDEVSRVINGRAMLQADLRRQLTEEAILAFS